MWRREVSYNFIFQPGSFGKPEAHKGHGLPGTLTAIENCIETTLLVVWGGYGSRCKTSMSYIAKFNFNKFLDCAFNFPFVLMSQHSYIHINKEKLMPFCSPK